jgi:RHS repeat-associated protein
VYEGFCYDALNRLTGYTLGTGGGAGGGDPGGGGTGGGGTGGGGIGGGGLTGGGFSPQDGGTCSGKTVSYDALGNIAAKSDVGVYSYNASGAGSVRPHAVASIANSPTPGPLNGVTNPAFTYDADGNMTAGAGRTISYWGINMPELITEGSVSSAFIYDTDHNRIASVVLGVSQTLYLNDPVSGAMEEAYTVSGSSTSIWHDYIQAEGQIVAERFCTSGTACATTATGWRYFVHDNLGSIVTATDATGLGDPAHTERDAYDPWGKRRNANGTDDTTCSLTSVTTRGFTGHEHVDANCLINMNARIYDPAIGRFMAADNTVADPADLQDWNAYSYVDNRPTMLTDPTGHEPFGLPGVGGGPSFFLAPIDPDDAPDTSGMPHDHGPKPSTVGDPAPNTDPIQKPPTAPSNDAKIQLEKHVSLKQKATWTRNLRKQMDKLPRKAALRLKPTTLPATQT